MRPRLNCHMHRVPRALHPAGDDLVGRFHRCPSGPNTIRLLVPITHTIVPSGPNVTRPGSSVNEPILGRFSTTLRNDTARTAAA